MREMDGKWKRKRTPENGGSTRSEWEWARARNLLSSVWSCRLFTLPVDIRSQQLPCPTLTQLHASRILPSRDATTLQRNTSTLPYAPLLNIITMYDPALQDSSTAAGIEGYNISMLNSSHRESWLIDNRLRNQMQSLCLTLLFVLLLTMRSLQMGSAGSALPLSHSIPQSVCLTTMNLPPSWYL